MIFNEMNSSVGVSHEAVQESPYDLGIGGALMHVYENECNYNALMKAAALSEMKYYNQTGGDLFVQEAGALSGFITKVKEFFKKVIEKIKSIAKKFVAKINQYTMKDKDFVKKYQTELGRKNLKDFKFNNGYEFPDWSGNISYSSVTSSTEGDGSEDQDTINDIIEKNRGAIVNDSPMTESEYRDALTEKLYGDKGDIEVKDIRKWINVISGTKDAIKKAEKEEKSTIAAINAIIDRLDKDIKELDKGANIDIRNKDDASAHEKDKKIKGLNTDISIFKAYANDLTIYFGAVTKALNDKNRQAKAICVKALSYKSTNESAVAENGSYGDIFAGVEIV